MSGIWYMVIGIGIASSWLFARLVFKPWLAKNKYAKPEAPSGEGGVSVKETCDIHGKVGASIRYDCGHDDAEEFRIDLWGAPTFHKKPAAGKLLCSDCFLKEVLSSTLRCADCGFAIMPGDPVAIRGVDKHMGKKAWRTMVGQSAVVCLCGDCDNAPGFCGHWMGNGIKPAFPDGGNMISQVFKTGEPLHVEIGPLKDSEPPTK